jgi:hypothetical protein
MTQAQFGSYFKFSIVGNPWDRAVSMYRYTASRKCGDFKAYLFGDFIRNEWRHNYRFVRPQFQFLYDDHGNMLVDFVGRFETLQPDFDYVCYRLGIARRTSPQVNRSPEQVDGRISARSYADYYDNEPREFVADLYKKDIELFGYRFDAASTSS